MIGTAVKPPGARPSVAAALGSIAVLLLLALALGLPAPASATDLAAERIPTTDPLYFDLERLATRFAHLPRFLSTRPMRRAEAVAFLDAVVATDAGAADDPAYQRARRALQSDQPGGVRPLGSWTGDSGEHAELSPYLAVRYSDDARNRPDLDRDYRAGMALAASFDSSWVVVTDLYAGTSSQGGHGTPNFSTLNALVEGVDFNAWLNEAYVEAGGGKLRVLAGHTWLRWGPGREGTLALSDAAPAFDLVRAELTPFRTMRWSWFVSLLDPGPQTYLAGHRLEWSPCARTSFGLTELARFDGNSQAFLYAMPLVPFSIWEKRRKTAPDGAIPGDTTGLALTKNNVLWSADFAWCPRPGLRLWGELMVDDFSFSRDYKPDLIGYQAGAAKRAGLGSGAIQAELEFTRVHNYTYSAFHGHHFEYQRFPVGFALGPDVASVGAGLSYEHGATWEFGVRGEWRRKGEGRVGHFWSPQLGQVDASAFEGVATEETRVSASIAYAPTRSLRLEATVGSSEMSNEDHVRGPDRGTTPFTLRGVMTW